MLLLCIFVLRIHAKKRAGCAVQLFLLLICNNHIMCVYMSSSLIRYPAIIFMQKIFIKKINVVLPAFFRCEILIIPTNGYNINTLANCNVVELHLIPPLFSKTVLLISYHSITSFHIFRHKKSIYPKAAR